jgi:hypothetical protein
MSYGNSLDAFYRQLADLSVTLGKAERHAEMLGFAKSAEKLMEMRASCNHMANLAMTKIEANHISRLERRKQLSQRFHSGGIVPPSSQVPRLLSSGCSGAYDPRLSPSQNMMSVTVGQRSAVVPAPNMTLQSSIDALEATGLQVVVIDENTDFDKLNEQLGFTPQPDPRQDGSVESPQADPPVELAPPSDQQGE